MKPLLVLLAVAILALPLIAKEEEGPAPPPTDGKPMVMIEAKFVRGPISRIATLRGSDSLPRPAEKLKPDTEEHVLVAPSLLCETGNIATVQVGTLPDRTVEGPDPKDLPLTLPVTLHLVKQRN